MPCVCALARALINAHELGVHAVARVTACWLENTAHPKHTMLA
jgi:hypothetical protein